jgi:hypothetical protein
MCLQCRLMVRAGMEVATCRHPQENAFIFGNAPTARLAPTKSNTFATPAAAALFASTEMTKAAAASADCPLCKAVYNNHLAQPHPPAPVPVPVPQEPLVRLPHLHCPPLVDLCPRLRACNLSSSHRHPAHSRCPAPPECAAGPGAHRRSHGGESKRDRTESGASQLLWLQSCGVCE